MDKDAGRTCVCADVRRTDRLLMQLYDRALAPSGLTGSQFALLTAISKSSPIAISRLADALGMDRTTLTRNLSVLAKRRYIRIETGADRRERVVQMTEEGGRMAKEARPLWQQAQAKVEAAFGPERLGRLLTELSDMRLALGTLLE
jgi:DNA-binding MarR family transcriptional regulator